jgi:hypothetical protein
MGVQASGSKSRTIDGGNGVARQWRKRMRSTSLKLVAVALAIVVAATSVAEAGKFSGLGIKGGNSGQSNPINPIIHHNDKSPDFDGVFNPKPDPVIYKVIDISKPDPVIHKVLDLFPDSPASGNGGFVSFREAARINPGLKLSCIVGGTPTEFPDDLFIANKGLVAVPAGTNVRWQIASLGLEGVATLQQTLKPGKSIGLRGVLEGGVEVGTPCAITAIGQ